MMHCNNSKCRYYDESGVCIFTSCCCDEVDEYEGVSGC